MKIIQSFVILIVLLAITGCSTKEYQQETTVSQQEILKKDIPQVQKAPPKQQTYPPKVVQKGETIAVVFPSSDIDRYALEATNTLNSYLLESEKNFSIETFDMMVQSKNNILKVFDRIGKKNIKKVILLITKDYVNLLQYVQGLENYKIVLPLVHKYEQTLNDKLVQPNIVYGAISYKKQFDKLIAYAKNYSLVEFYDNSPIGDTLHKYVKQNNLKYSRIIDDNNGRYKTILKYHKNKIDNSAVILNTPIVKSSILLSAATAEELEIPLVLSTQLNFTPLLFSLTQVHDRKNLVIASSIGELPADLREYNNILGNNILYNWVNYSCIVAAEYLIHGNINRFEELAIKDNQIIYPVKLYDVKYYSFKLIN